MSNSAYYGLWVAALCVATAAIALDAVRKQRHQELTQEEAFEKQHVLTDPRTRCQYLRGHQELTPRMGADGKQLCGGGGK